VFSDFDGDGRADASVFRPSEGNWYISRSLDGMTAVQWGIGTDKLTPADFDGDNKADIAVWRPGPPTVAAFYILRSSDNTLDVEQFGQTGDDPTIVADWDGDGKADPAVYRDSANGAQSYFYYRPSANPTVNLTSVQWGLTGDRAMPGDFDGDGRADTAVFRPATGIWYISFSTRGASRADYWGLATDKFVPGDYDGDGRNDLAVFRNGIWYIKQSSDGQAAYFQWGLATDKPVPADYDGDGRTDAAVYRNGTWYIRLSSGGTAAGDFGLSTDIPVSGAYVK